MLPTEVAQAERAAVSIMPEEGTADAPKAVPSISEMERQLILEALRLTSGSVPEAAKQLGLSPATLYRKVKKFGISRDWSDKGEPEASA